MERLKVEQNITISEKFLRQHCMKLCETGRGFAMFLREHESSDSETLYEIRQ